MKQILVSAMAAALAVSFAASASANTTGANTGAKHGAKHQVSASIEASCKQQAAKKFSAIHFLKRRNFANNCEAQHANAKAKPAVTTGQAVKAQPSTTGQGTSMDQKK